MLFLDPFIQSGSFDVQAYKQISGVKEALQNPISERWGKQICLN